MLKINYMSTLFVGIDVSSKSNVVCAMDFDENKYISSSFGNNQPGADELAEKILLDIDSRLSLHDFRVVPYKSGRKLIFDVAVPWNFTMTDRDLRKEFQRRLIELHSDDRAIIHIDHQYC